MKKQSSKIIVNNPNWRKNIRANLQWENEELFSIYPMQETETINGEKISVGKLYNLEKAKAKFERL